MSARLPKFDRTYCSQCGAEFGPADHGYSHCRDHRRLTADQLQALQVYAAQHGRTWKSQLLDLWMSGKNENAGALRQVRNNFGPRWLMKFRLPAPATAES